MKKVVITGLGAMTAAGEGADKLWEAVVHGRSGIETIGLGEGGLRAAAGQVPDFDPEKFVTQRKALKVMARDIQLAVASASLAMKDAKADTFSFNRERFGVIVGSGVLNHDLDELAYSVQSSLDDKGKLSLEKFGSDGLSSLFPLWLLKYLPNMSACHISILFDLRGMNNTITTGASAGLQAVGEAFRIIERGDADMMLAGGAESKVNPVGLSQYKMLGAFSDASQDPKTAYRPFDAQTKGFVVGEGAGFLVLEELEHAKKRNAKIYARITGFGSSSMRGQKTAMNAAIKESGVDISKVHYLQACGLGLSAQDSLEGEAIESVFNGRSRGLLVSASKAVTGFTGFSAGALDLIISTMALQKEIIPPVLNFSKSSREWEFEIVKGSAVKKKIECAVTHVFGFGGQAASMITQVHKG